MIETETSETHQGTILVDIDQGIASVIINHPSKLNAFTSTMCHSLISYLQALDSDPNVKVIALQGAGGNFSAGADITNVEQLLFSGSNSDSNGIDLLSAVDESITNVQKPIFSFVQGICMGGGWQIASAADAIIASSDTRLAITPSKLGIIYPRAGLERLKRYVGESRANYLLMTAREITIEKAEAWNLVAETVDASIFEKYRNRLLRSVASRSQFSIFAMKKLMQLEGTTHYCDAWEKLWSAVQTNEDFVEGRSAFMETRPPEFDWNINNGSRLLSRTTEV